MMQDCGSTDRSDNKDVEVRSTEQSAGHLLTKSSKNSPTSSGSEMNCKRNLNGSGGRREIGIPR